MLCQVEVLDIHSHYLEWTLDRDKIERGLVLVAASLDNGTLWTVPAELHCIHVNPFPPPVPNEGFVQSIPRDITSK